MGGYRGMSGYWNKYGIWNNPNNILEPLDSIYTAAILELKQSLDDWVLKLRTSTPTLQIIHKRPLWVVTCALPRKPHYNFKWLWCK